MGALLFGTLAVGAFLVLTACPSPKSRAGLTEDFDALYCRHCRGIPIEYLRALAKRESDENPGDASGPAWGLLQVVPVVLQSYNERFGTDFEREDLLDPDLNVEIACELLRRIPRQYVRRHPQSFPRVDWTDRTFVELVTFGWNAGFSERAGVGYVVGGLEERGIEPTLESVHQEALRDGNASRFLRVPGRVAFARGVVDLYFREAGVPEL